MAEKEKGNAAYKQKDFATALQHYDKAIELDPANMTFLTNKAGMLMRLWGVWLTCVYVIYSSYTWVWG